MQAGGAQAALCAGGGQAATVAMLGRRSAYSSSMLWWPKRPSRQSTSGTEYAACCSCSARMRAAGRDGRHHVQTARKSRQPHDPVVVG